MHNIIICIYGISLLVLGTEAGAIYRSVETGLDAPANEDAAALVERNAEGNMAPVIGKLKRLMARDCDWDPNEPEPLCGL